MHWGQAVRRAPKILAKSALANLLPAELFDPQVDLTTSRELFSLFVRMVEIENHSYCNRTCWFCPNAQLDRRSGNTLMQPSVYEKILLDLQSIDYSQTLSWSRYHEPLAHDSIYDRIAQARQRLPLAHLLVISNGDYLNRDSLRKLEDAGLDRMMLDLYLPDGKERDAPEIRAALDKFAARTGLDLAPVGDYDYRCEGTKVNITMGIPLYSAANMSTRGGLVKIQELDHFQRTAVCFNPMHSVTVDYNGKCVLCCQVRSDSPRHQDATFGDLSSSGYGLFHFYRDLAPARRGLLSPGPKLGACSTCTISGVGPNRLARRKSIAFLAAHFPGVQPAFRAALKRASRHRKYELV
ncbi:MAG TPA: radical SAM protein [Candidatus Acidoferrales bacterium]|nr:radical SAM protein [Candidatus Acidoferrales bacterium]